MPGPEKYYAGPYKVFIVSIMPGTSDHLYTQEPLSSTWDCFVWMEMCEYLSPNILSAFSLGNVIFIHSFIGAKKILHTNKCCITSIRICFYPEFWMLSQLRICKHDQYLCLYCFSFWVHNYLSRNILSAFPLGTRKYGTKINAL